jgi:pimeloyl-ACP methyl ester carboxylesterase
MTIALDPDPVEQAGYFEVPGAHLYTVLHQVPDPSARMLLVGPFASERHTSYVSWASWARYLAARGIECLRYDYRGMGESTGDFAEMSFVDWTRDVELLAQWLDSRSPKVPLLLHGLEIGALLASQAFEASSGDALLLWSPPDNANEVLRVALQRRVATDNMFRFGDERKKAADYISRLEIEPLEVDGYRWTSRLWQDSFRLKPWTGIGQPDSAGACAEPRPVRTVQLGLTAEPLVKGNRYVSINPDFAELFAQNFEWIATMLPGERKACYGNGN